MEVLYIMKDKLVIHKGLEVCASTRHGYGVFTSEGIMSGSIVEECMCCIQTVPLMSGILDEYRFAGPSMLAEGETVPSKKYHVIPTGFGMVYNHSNKPNLEWKHNVEDRLIVFNATTEIQPGEELTHDYGRTVKLNNKNI